MGCTVREAGFEVCRPLLIAASHLVRISRFLQAEAIAKGHTGFNATALYGMFRRQATEARPHASRAAVEEWVAHGYVPVEAASVQRMEPWRLYRLRLC